MKEVILLIFMINKKIINDVASSKKLINKLSMQDIVFFYEQVEDMHVENVLDAIDVLTTEVNMALNEYEINSVETYSDWLRQYWWIVPSVGVLVGLKVWMQHTVKVKLGLTSWLDLL